jgi:opacity protein-like surface antigen
MKRASIILAVIISFASGMAGSNADAAGSTGSISALIGTKYINTGDWSDSRIGLDLSKQTEQHLDIDLGGHNTRFVIEALVSRSKDSFSFKNPDYSGPVNLQGDGTHKTTIELSTKELRLGVRQIFDAAPWIHPYIGIGLAYIHAGANAYGSVTNPGEASYSYDLDASDNAFGDWIGGGIYFDILNGLFVGVDLSYSAAKAGIDLFDGDQKIGGTHAAIKIGTSW